MKAYYTTITRPESFGLVYVLRRRGTAPQWVLVDDSGVVASDGYTDSLRDAIVANADAFEQPDPDGVADDYIAVLQAEIESAIKRRVGRLAREADTGEEAAKLLASWGWKLLPN